MQVQVSDQTYPLHPPEERPTKEQLVATVTILKAGKHPAVDFAVFGPFGARLAQALKFEGPMWIGHEHHTRQLAGPRCYVNWELCWKIFENSMIMCGPASQGAF